MEEGASEGAPQMPTPAQIREDLQSAKLNDIVFTNPPVDTDSTEPPLPVVLGFQDVKKATDLVNATKYLKEKGESELPKAIADISDHTDELKTALKTMSSER